MRARAHRIHASALLVLAGAVLQLGAGVASARQPPLRTVRYHGYSVQIPRSWPVYRLGADPRTCVRFDRHALYLGEPSPVQACPAHAAGRTEAILIEPVDSAHASRAARAWAASAVDAPPAARLGRSATTFEVAGAGVRVTATWAWQRDLIARALHRRSLPAPPAPHPARVRSALLARAASAGVRSHQAGAVYEGLGFDACSTPSEQAMSDWQSSPYRAIGIYIGGINAACSQPNLTTTWTATEVAAGWHLIPTYVGLQAPSNSCGCASISPSQASAEGTAAADDAVVDAEAVGIPTGNPVYDDMESYARTTTNTAAVLAFLASWTSELHAKGYLSGVYSSADSGITDLVNQYGTSYPEPDDIWIADWNGEQATSDSYVPVPDWEANQRLHQYSGGQDETYGGYKINIDNDYLDGATADTVSGAPPPPPPPTLNISPASDGTTSLTAKWSSGTGLSSWLALAGSSASTLTPVGRTSAHGTAAQFALRTAAPYFAVQALGSSGRVLANSSTVPTPAFLALYGHSAFVSETSGIGGIPAGCYTGAACHVATTILYGRRTIASTGNETIGQDSTGILFFKLTAAGRTLLLHARGGRLLVRVSAHDSSGSVVAGALALIPFATSGRGPARNLSQSPAVRIVGVTDFVFDQGAGGILAGCVGVVPCRISAKLTVGRTTIASTGGELVGGNELGYVFFSPTSRGRSLLAAAHGNQLGATLKLTDGTDVASGSVTLVQFS